MSGAEVINFGCRLNINEAEIIRRNTENLENTVILNTCAVTNEAVRQARQTIRRIKREKPDVRIIVTGCAAQTESERFLEMPEVNLILGNAEKFNPENYQITNERIRITDIQELKETAGHLVQGFNANTRAFLQIQNGCDHRCTFCIIPYGRGPSRSIAAGQIVEQIRDLVKVGYREVVLTGVDLTDYGSDLPGKPRLGNLVRRILKLVPELERLRISSLDSAEADEDLLIAFAEDSRLMPHVHLSLQSGDNLILKRMKRRHNAEQANKFVQELRKARPDIVLGADFIAGFPTETDEMFENTCAHVEELNIAFLHVFPYSSRPNTPAAKMPQISGEIIRKRAQRLRKIGQKQFNKLMQAEIGKTRNILIEKDGNGRSEHYIPVKFSQKIQAGQIVQAKLQEVKTSYMVGVLAP